MTSQTRMNIEQLIDFSVVYGGNKCEITIFLTGNNDAYIYLTSYLQI